MLPQETENRKRILYSITEEEVQSFALDKLGRKLNEKEIQTLMGTFAGSIEIHFPVCIRVSQDAGEIGPSQSGRGY